MTADSKKLTKLRKQFKVKKNLIVNSMNLMCISCNTFMLKVHILTVLPWCSCVVAVKFCCIKTSLEVHSSSVMATCFSVIGVFIQFT